MKKTEILKFLKENDLSDVELLKSEKEYMLVNFYLDFDKDILDAAKAYANEECEEDENSEKWLQEYYFQYLYDFANDEVLEIVEEVTEDFEIAGEFMAFQMKEKTDDYVQFMVLFSDEESDLVIEDVVKDYMQEKNN